MQLGVGELPTLGKYGGILEEVVWEEVKKENRDEREKGEERGRK